MTRRADSVTRLRTTLKPSRHLERTISILQQAKLCSTNAKGKKNKKTRETVR